MKIKKPKRIMSLFLAALMCVTCKRSLQSYAIEKERS